MADIGVASQLFYTRENGMKQQFWAHSHPSQPEPDDKWQPLCVHLQNVARLAEQFAKAARPDDDETFAQTAYLAGLLLDNTVKIWEDIAP